MIRRTAFGRVAQTVAQPAESPHLLVECFGARGEQLAVDPDLAVEGEHQANLGQ